MKKKVFLVLIAILLTAFAAAATACNYKNDGKENAGGGGITVVEKDFCNTDNIGYNEEYEGGKGFFIYDVIDFNAVTFEKIKVDTTKSPVFEIWHNNVLLKSIEKGNNASLFEKYAFDRTGVHKINIIAHPKTGKEKLRKQLEIDIKSGGRPTSVNITFTDSAGKTVDAPVAGEVSYVNAVIRSDANAITDISDKVSFGWRGETVGQRRLKIEPENSLWDTKITAVFEVSFATNNGGGGFSKNFEFTVKNNFDKIEFNYDGLQIVNGRTTLNAYCVNDVNVFKKISAEYVYLNGDREPCTIQTDGKSPVDGAVVLTVKYNGDSQSAVYSEFYNYTSALVNYDSRGAKYQLNPAKQTAVMNLAITKKEILSAGIRYLYEPISGSEYTVTITNPLANIEINNVAYRSVSNGVGYNAEIDAANGEFTVSKIKPGTEEKFHNFAFIPEVTGVGAKDLVYTIENEVANMPAVVLFRQSATDESNGYFVPLNEGVCYITVKSAFGNFSKRFKVTVTA